MSDTAAGHDDLASHDRVYPEKLRLASNVILQLGEDPGILPDTLQTELFLFRDRVEMALLLPESASGLLPWRDTPAPEPDAWEYDEHGGIRVTGTDIIVRTRSEERP